MNIDTGFLFALVGFGATISGLLGTMVVNAKKSEKRLTTIENMLENHGEKFSDLERQLDKVLDNFDKAREAEKRQTEDSFRRLHERVDKIFEAYNDHLLKYHAMVQ